MRVRDIIGSLVMVVIVMALAGGCNPESPGAETVVTPESTETPAATESEAAIDDEGIHWWYSYDMALGQAAALDMPLLVDVGTEWCGPCQMLEENTFPHADVQALANDFVWVKIDADESPDIAEALGVQAYPTLIIMNSAGEIEFTGVGYVTGPQLAKSLRQYLDEKS